MRIRRVVHDLHGENPADSSHYQAHCGCDVSQLLLPDTAHVFMVHKSLPSWVDDVVNWLRAHRLAGTP